ncbi:Uncharacterized HTH-type transcriptional regulator yhcF [Stenotrophomonas maltophilia RA8]|nr:Uncharacterized HTH-type transcriptional regulator yhcF [Stenotrophomonas maltophilia RA8]
MVCTSLNARSTWVAHPNYFFSLQNQNLEWMFQHHDHPCHQLGPARTCTTACRCYSCIQHQSPETGGSHERPDTSQPHRTRGRCRFDPDRAGLAGRANLPRLNRQCAGRDHFTGRQCCPLPLPPASAAQLPVHAVLLVRPAADPTELNMSDIQWSDGAPIYRQLKERVIAMMLDGILKPGDALPSVRQVAADYQLNPITVSRAYQELADEGLVEKRRGLGMFMTEQAATQLRSSERERFLNEEWPAVLERIQRLGLSLDELLPQGKF